MGGADPGMRLRGREPGGHAAARARPWGQAEHLAQGPLHPDPPTRHPRCPPRPPPPTAPPPQLMQLLLLPPAAHLAPLDDPTLPLPLHGRVEQDAAALLLPARAAAEEGGARHVCGGQGGGWGWGYRRASGGSNADPRISKTAVGELLPQEAPPAALRLQVPPLDPAQRAGMESPPSLQAAAHLAAPAALQSAPRCLPPTAGTRRPRRS